jgi:pimeloyl-ACP methyl ester carboxylesterase
MTTQPHPPLPRPLALPGGTVEYVDHGGPGEPVLLIHAGAFGAWFEPLATQPALNDFRAIRMLRAGYTDAPPPTAPLSIAAHASHAAALLEHLDAAPAHVVGHSSGCVIALQLALDRPELVRSLVLSEPPLIDQLAAPEDLALLHQMLGPVLATAMGAAAAGDIPTAFHAFMNLICGPDHQSVLTATLGPDALPRAYRDAAYFFTGEIPALGQWQFPSPDAADIHHPTLLVQGGTSPPPTHHLTARLATTLPHADIATIDGDNHLITNHAVRTSQHAPAEPNPATPHLHRMNGGQRSDVATAGPAPSQGRAVR